MQTLSIGSTLQGGKYVIKKVLGQGGFGITYLAEHDLLGTDVAIKEFFMKDYCNREEYTSRVSIGTQNVEDLVCRFREKFIKEARNIAKLKHPNIVSIHDIFEENGTAYYVMDYCDGGSLSEIICNSPDKRISEEEAIRYVCQVASALQYIHERKMNHLDIKPGNILLSENGEAILIDFGMSKQYDSTGSQTSTTPIGISHGYAPIEQYKQGGVKEFSPQTDIYALGATFYKLITGQTPPDAQDLLDEDLPEIMASDFIVDAIHAAMQPRRINRPKSVNEWLEILKSQNDHGSIVSESGNLSQTSNPVLNITNDEETVFLYSDKGEINGHEWIDLGLSVLWSTCNVGATYPHQFGSKQELNSNTLQKMEDTWGERWRIPTKEEFEELFSNCDCKWNGQGFDIKSLINGNSIILPAGGFQLGDSNLQSGNLGFYWTSTIESDEAWRLRFSGKNKTIDKTYLYYCLSIRPVVNKWEKH